MISLNLLRKEIKMMMNRMMSPLTAIVTTMMRAIKKFTQKTPVRVTTKKERGTENFRYKSVLQIFIFKIKVQSQRGLSLIHI